MTFENIKDIRALISSLVSNKIDAGQVVNQEWTVTEILNTYNDISGDDVDFYIIAARHWVNNEVKSVIGKFDPEIGKDNSQLVLDGFEYLQKAYPVLRGAVRQLVPVEQITDDEWELKAFEYEKMGDGCYAHAAEMRRYKNSRKQSA